ncbi:YebC/PmpR family DNA-binding transcriptional regulator [Advenella alkanexedens]|jgi:YebC/PmpR family DNA-binding regulatory protein|uniref:Probable transcriptional regulatory protein KU392_01355 n=1 Tax=Advenella alkanexedens TaxID=1481665 RepID=A0ABS6NKK0_9BURK|nr:YebC/PmpR family DNA-binding transcriptional regulator [Advenella alkanexedens]MBV4395899.1 YebC/PmpR family DNA-binding transcriptional regulator [Advenella alkanexedens]NLN67854.1 YebC/PmpR family DNA-binding transcriptional regulator [Alcaligenaceae bacterium]
MAGHSKWANIQHRKGRQDAKRGKIWTKIIREITVAARAGGPDPSANPALRLAWDKATAANMPKDNIQRAITRGAGGADGANYESIRYEGYGVSGAALIIDCMTDNRVRTVSDVRHALTKHGGNLGQDGSVAFMFQHCGQFIFAPGTSEEKIMEVALEAGADDIQTDEDGMIEVVCAPEQYAAVRDAFIEAELKPEMEAIVMKPLNETLLTGDDAKKMQKILDQLESLDDVQEVYTTAVFDETEE